MGSVGVVTVAEVRVVGWLAMGHIYAVSGALLRQRGSLECFVSFSVGACMLARVITVYSPPLCLFACANHDPSELILVRICCLFICGDVYLCRCMLGVQARCGDSTFGHGGGDGAVARGRGDCQVSDEQTRGALYVWGLYILFKLSVLTHFYTQFFFFLIRTST